MDVRVAGGIPAQDHDGLPIPRRYWSAATIWLAIAMAVLDGSIANVALPSIARQLEVDPATSVWIVNSYQLAITMLLLPFAALGDRIGYHRVYFPSLALDSGPALLLAAAIAAFMAAGISMLRLRVAPPARVAVSAPVVD